MCSVAVVRFRGAEFSRPDPPAEVLLAGDPDAGPDVEVRGPSWKTHLLTRLQAQQVNGFSSRASSQQLTGWPLASRLLITLYINVSLIDN